MLRDKSKCKKSSRKNSQILNNNPTFNLFGEHSMNAQGALVFPWVVAGKRCSNAFKYTVGI